MQASLACARALGKIRNEKAYPSLLFAIDDQDKKVQKAAIEALEYIAGLSFSEGRQHEEERQEELQQGAVLDLFGEIAGQRDLAQCLQFSLPLLVLADKAIDLGCHFVLDVRGHEVFPISLFYA